MSTHPKVGDKVAQVLAAIEAEYRDDPWQGRDDLLAAYRGDMPVKAVSEWTEAGLDDYLNYMKEEEEPDADPLTVPELLQAYMQPAVETIAEKIEGDLLNLYAGFQSQQDQDLIEQFKALIAEDVKRDAKWIKEHMNELTVFLKRVE